MQAVVDEPFVLEMSGDGELGIMRFVFDQTFFDQIKTSSTKDHCCYSKTNREQSIRVFDTWFVEKHVASLFCRRHLVTGRRSIVMPRRGCRQNVFASCAVLQGLTYHSLRNVAFSWSVMGMKPMWRKSHDPQSSFFTCVPWI